MSDVDVLRDALTQTAIKFEVVKVEFPPEARARLGDKEIYVREMTTDDWGYVDNGKIAERKVGEDTLFVNDFSRQPHHVIIRTACNKKGERIFADDDMPIVGRIPKYIAEPIYDAAMRLSSAKVKAALEGLEKNSQPSSGSTSS